MLFQKEKSAPKSKAHELLEAERAYRKGMTSVRDLIAPSAMRIDTNNLQVSGKFARTYFVLTYPRYISTDWLSPIINLDVAMDISLFIYPMETDGVMKKLRDKVGQLEASIAINQAKGEARDMVDREMFAAAINDDEVAAGANETTKICWNLVLAPFFVL